MALSSSSDCMGFSKAMPLQADSLKHLSSLQRRIVKGAVEQSGEASSGPSPVCPVVVSLPGRDSDFDQRSGMDIFQPQPPPRSLVRCRMPPIPTPMLKDGKSATPLAMPLPSSRIVMISWPFCRFRLTQPFLALEWRSTLVIASGTIRNIALSNSGASLGNSGGC